MNKQTAERFVRKWKNKGDEKQDTEVFWRELLSTVYDVENSVMFEETYFSVEERTDKDGKKGKDFKDIVINTGTNSQVLIEQKSHNIPLDRKIKQSDGSELTPFEQAKKYWSNSSFSDIARWIITCNFQNFWIYDMEKTGVDRYDPIKLKLEDLPKNLDWLSMILPASQQVSDPKFVDEMEVSKEAGYLVGEIYEKLHKCYINNETNKDERLKRDNEIAKHLNKLCVRIVFCLYAEDAGLFSESNSMMFYEYLNNFEAVQTRKALIDLFEVLDQKIEERDPYEMEANPLLAAFPYVNGGLFSGKIEIPNFNNEIRDLLLNKASLGFDWSKISPTIFGAVFESTLNPETRHQGGMHYTSIENIHKVIDPLFLDDLKARLDEALNKPVAGGARTKALRAYQDYIASLTFFDPACGSGNFLTETYLSLRRLENEALLECSKDIRIQMDLYDEFENTIKVSIHQFYGIEINDFAVSVAKTALWIAEAQMYQESVKLFHMAKDFFPLKTYANIHEGNALRIDWNNVVPNNKLDFIVGNPPFRGARLMSSEQKNDMVNVFDNIKGVGNLDYVTAWYKKAADYMSKTSIETAFVSTNSVSQGEQVSILWKPLMLNQGIKINFAHKTFKWESEAYEKAAVHCVIIGFSCKDKDDKIIYSNETYKKVSNINGYLVEAPNIFIESRRKPISNVSEMAFGSMSNDGGNLILTKEEKEDLIKMDKSCEKIIRPFIGSKEFINREERYCLWLDKIEPKQYRLNKVIMERIKNVYEHRISSTRKATREKANVPYLFGEIRQPDTEYLLVPRVSSENRRYIPMGYMTPNIVASDAVMIIPDATLYEFGVLESNVHMAWMRAVAGRLEMRYRYSKNIVYNNFPWPNPTEEQQKKIEMTSQAILDARALHPNCTLADLYDPLVMPMELRKAHEANDKAVMQAYGFATDMSEEEIFAGLVKMYEGIISNN